MQSFLKQSRNRFLQLLARFLPGATSLRPALHRLRGVRIDGKVWIGDDVYLENSHPDAIELHDRSGINMRSTLIAHWRGTGRIVVETEARIGACCVVVASADKTLVIGRGAMLAAGSVVSKSVSPYTLVAGNPARPIARITVPPVLETSYIEFKRGLRPIETDGDSDARSKCTDAVFKNDDCSSDPRNPQGGATG